MPPSSLPCSTESASSIPVKYFGCVRCSSRTSSLKRGLNTIQSPLIHLYSDVRRRHLSGTLGVDQLLTNQFLHISNYGLIITEHDGQTQQSVITKVITPLTNVVLYAAVRFSAKFVRQRGQKYSVGAFIPISCCETLFKSKTFQRIQRNERFLTHIQHPAMFVCVLRRISANKIFDVHLFSTFSESNAIRLSTAVSEIVRDSNPGNFHGQLRRNTALTPTDVSSYSVLSGDLTRLSRSSVNASDYYSNTSCSNIHTGSENFVNRVNYVNHVLGCRTRSEISANTRRNELMRRKLRENVIVESSDESFSSRPHDYRRENRLISPVRLAYKRPGAGEIKLNSIDLTGSGGSRSVIDISRDRRFENRLNGDFRVKCRSELNAFGETRVKNRPPFDGFISDSHVKNRLKNDKQHDIRARTSIDDSYEVNNYNGYIVTIPKESHPRLSSDNSRSERSSNVSRQSEMTTDFGRNFDWKKPENNDFGIKRMAARRFDDNLVGRMASMRLDSYNGELFDEDIRHGDVSMIDRGRHRTVTKRKLLFFNRFNVKNWLGKSFRFRRRKTKATPSLYARHTGLPIISVDTDDQGVNRQKILMPKVNDESIFIGLSDSDRRSASIFDHLETIELSETGRILEHYPSDSGLNDSNSVNLSKVDLLKELGYFP